MAGNVSTLRELRVLRRVTLSGEQKIMLMRCQRLCSVDALPQASLRQSCYDAVADVTKEQLKTCRLRSKSHPVQ